MKKIVKLLIALCVLVPGAIPSMTALATSSLSVSFSYDVEVVKITTHATARTSGVYDKSTNTILIHGKRYNVRSNPNYGKGGKTSSYQYCAGDAYYFNL